MKTRVEDELEDAGISTTEERDQSKTSVGYVFE